MRALIERDWGNMTGELAPDDSTGYRIEVADVGPCWLLGNGHTHAGRMVVLVIGTDMTLHVSKHEIVEPSPSVAAWIEGFLAGQEPDYDAWRGWAEDERVDDADYDDPAAWARYRAFIRAFQERGYLPYAIQRRPTVPPPAEWADRAWIHVAGEVLGWDGSAWAPKDPQPAFAFGTLVGSVCADDDAIHESEVVGPGVLVCSDCGLYEHGLSWDENPADA